MGEPLKMCIPVSRPDIHCPVRDNDQRFPEPVTAFGVTRLFIFRLQGPEMKTGLCSTKIHTEKEACQGNDPLVGAEGSSGSRIARLFIKGPVDPLNPLPVKESFHESFSQERPQTRQGQTLRQRPQAIR